MTDKKSSRRKLLKSIAAGSGAVVAGKSLPESWSKPIVNSVMLPAHAEATTTTTTTTTTTLEPCCDIAGKFCGRFMDNDYYIEITVDSVGAISIVVEIGVDGPVQLTTSVSCVTGGFFSATDGTYTVTGTVDCNATSIAGLYSEPGLSDEPYLATKDGCLT